MRSLRLTKKGTLPVGTAALKRSWVTPRKKLSARILGHFIGRTTAEPAHQAARWNWPTKEASTKLKVGVSKKMARRFSSLARSFRYATMQEIWSVLSIYFETRQSGAMRTRSW